MKNIRSDDNSVIKDENEGLILCAYVAPSIALEKGKYEALNRDRALLSNRVFELASKDF